MSDLTVVGILIQPDAAAIEMGPGGQPADAVEHPGRDHPGRHALPHITMLQRYPITANLDQASAAIAAVREAVARA